MPKTTASTSASGRTFRRLRLAVPALLLVLLAAGGILLGTESGLSVAWRLLAPLLSEHVSLGGMRGRLVGPLTLEDLEVRGDWGEVRLRHVALDWQPGKLLSGTLRVDYLRARGLGFEGAAAAQPAESGPPALPQRLPLPLSLDLAELSLQEGRLRMAPDAPALAVQRLQAAVSADRDGLRITGLLLDSDLLVAAGAASLALAQPYHLEAGLAATLRPPGYPEMPVRTRLAGDLHALDVALYLEPPYGLTLTGQVLDLAAEARLHGRLQAANLALLNLRPDLPDATLEADLALAGTLREPALSGTLSAAAPEYGRARLRLDAGWADATLQLRRATLQSPGGAGALTTRGRVGFGGPEPVLDLGFEWRELQWPLAGEPRLASPRGKGSLRGVPSDLDVDLDAVVGPAGGLRARGVLARGEASLELDWTDLGWPQDEVRLLSPRGSLTFNGAPEAYRLQLQAELTGPQLPSANVRLAGEGDSRGLRLQTLQADTLEGRLTGTGAVTWTPELSASLSLTGQGINPGQLLADWPGELGLGLEARVDPVQGEPTLRLVQGHLFGTLRGRPLDARVAGSYRAGRVDVERLALAVADSRLQLAGQALPEPRIIWSLDSPDLAALLPGAAGSLRGGGRLGGIWSAPVASWELQGRELGYGRDRIQRIETRGDLDMGGGRPSSVLLQAGSGLLAGRVLESLELQVEGRPGQHEARLRLQARDGGLQAGLRGGLTADRWDFSLRELALIPRRLPALNLLAPVSGTVAPGRVSLQRACLGGGDARLCGSLDSRSGKLQADLHLQDLDPGVLAPLLPPDLRAGGRLWADASLTRAAPGAPLTGFAELRGQGLELVSTLEDGRDLPLVRTRGSRLRLDLEPRAVTLRLNLPFEGGGGLDADLKASGSQSLPLDMALSGELGVSLPTTAVLAALIPDLEQVRGSLTGRMAISGTLGEPRGQGRLQLSGGRFELRRSGALVHDMELVLEGGSDGRFRLTGRARSGPGQVALEGEGHVQADGMRGRFRLHGQRFQVADITQATVLVSPDLTLEVGPDRLDLEGEVRVPEARIRIRELPESAVRVSADQRLVGQQEPDPASRRPFRATVRLVLGDQVRFSGFGLRARLGGNMVIRDEPGRETRASGRLEILEGHYRAYGQQLQILRGRLFFAGGPVDEPGLDFEAVRRPRNDITVGVRASGTLTDPELRVFSDPEMGQAQKLSWLMLGRSLEDETSSDEQDALSRAAIGLGALGAEVLGEDFAMQMGVDQIGVETEAGETGEQASFVVGKYLSPKLFVSYGIGLYEAVSTLRIRYDLTRRWLLLGESATTHSGADLFYTIESGR